MLTGLDFSTFTTNFWVGFNSWMFKMFNTNGWHTTGWLIPFVLFMLALIYGEQIANTARKVFDLISSDYTAGKDGVNLPRYVMGPDGNLRRAGSRLTPDQQESLRFGMGMSLGQTALGLGMTPAGFNPEGELEWNIPQRDPEEDTSWMGKGAWAEYDHPDIPSTTPQTDGGALTELEMDGSGERGGYQDVVYGDG